MMQVLIHNTQNNNESNCPPIIHLKFRVSVDAEISFSIDYSLVVDGKLMII